MNLRAADKGVGALDTVQRLDADVKNHKSKN